MAWIRQLPSGLWAATVRTPGGRITESWKLKSQAAAWAREQEEQVARGDWIDPRLGVITVGELWQRYGDSRQLERASRLRDESHWRCHVAPRWAKARAGEILKPDVTAWVTDMRRRKVGAATIQGALGVLRSVLEVAVDARLIRSNPARDVKAPARDAHLDRVLTPDEDDQLLDACDRLFPGRADARLFVELLLYCGLRWEEAGALDRDHVDMRRALLRIGPVLERDGTVRPYPKSPAGKRPVPVDDELWPRLRAHCLTRTGLIVTTPQGKPLDYSRWHARVWSVVLEGKPAYAGAQGHPARAAVHGAQLDDPQPTPHDLRHTYGTRLGEQGIPGHEIASIMGHESLISVQRYLHAGDGRHDRARDAVKRARSS